MIRPVIPFFLSILLSVAALHDACAQIRVLIRPWRPKALVLAPAHLPPPVLPASGAGYLDLHVIPADADVFVDGIHLGRAEKYAGAANYLALIPGEHSVSLRKDGFKPENCRIKIRRGQVIVLDIDMEKISGKTPQESVYQLEMEKTGYLTVKTEPSDAVIYINDTFYGTAAQFMEGEGSIVLREGKHQLVIQRPGFLPYSSEIEIKQDKTSEFVIKLEKTE